jgi:hypothetical protein
VDFVIWGSEGAWFWFLINPRGMGGMIGASTNEAQAVREARLSIERMLPLAMTPTPTQKQSARFLLMNGLKFGEERKTHHVQAVVAPKNRKSVRTLAESSRSRANYRWTNSLSLRSASFEL